MAENLLTHSLHTKAKYAQQLSDIYETNRANLFKTMVGNVDIVMQIANLEAREQTYYSAAEANGYEQFRKKIAEVIDDDVAYGISQLGGATLRNNLEHLKKQHINETLEVQQEIAVIIDTYGLEKANKGINSSLRNLTEEFEKIGRQQGKESFASARFTRRKGGQIVADIKPDPRIIKELLNFFDEVNDEGNKRRGRKYSTDSAKVSTALMTRLSELEEKGYFKLVQEEENSSKRLSDTLKTSQKFLGYPWSFRKGDIEIALLQADDAPFKERLRKALRDIRDWLLAFAGNSSPLRRAIIEEWEKIVGKNETDLTNASFFLKGGYIELVVGAMGEFQTAVFQNLLSQYFPKMRSNFSASIQGNVFGEGTSEQAKADVVFGQLGIQVKNYSSPARKIEGNIHPLELNKYYDENHLYDSGFFGILANRFWIEFEGIGIDEIATDLNDAVSAILNFDVLYKHLDDKISFYMIGGKYLVPASVILSYYADIQKGNQKYVEITSSTQPKNENEFDDELYWTPKGDNEYSRKKSNEQNMIKLLNHDISLRAQFNYGNIPNLEKYALW